MKKVLLTAGLVFAAGLVGFAATSLTSGGFSVQSVMGRQHSIDKQKHMDGRDIQRIQVAAEGTDVTIVPSKDGQIAVHFYGTGNEAGVKSVHFGVEQKGNELVVAVKTDDFTFLKNLQTNLEIALPKKQYERLLLRTSSGDIEVSGAQAKNLDIQTSSGDMRITDTAAEKTSLQASSGDISSVGLQGQLHANTSSGDVKLQAADIVQQVGIETSSGDVTIELEKEPASLALEFESSSGDGRTDMKLEGEEKGKHSLRGKTGTGEYKLQVETSSGDFQLRVK
ncbi:DUF4097 family beta strand repeat-containing protein [Ectobacillus ponti]|uniref:DUF4097 domain-containing protein n=1 Tax=Ectobacillus ponti TaxID=2961894 RepID=A0AA41X5X7_9BACI|nr:DUF4097 family beta strand repeat-containing protein [Ectobacillus ponti]MCP8969546.1 DUF4097 domain-containing protein [Ectobacillus ponti]